MTYKIDARSVSQNVNNSKLRYIFISPFFSPTNWTAALTCLFCGRKELREWLLEIPNFYQNNSNSEYVRFTYVFAQSLEEFFLWGQYLWDLLLHRTVGLWLSGGRILEAGLCLIYLWRWRCGNFHAYNKWCLDFVLRHGVTLATDDRFVIELYVFHMIHN